MTERIKFSIYIACMTMMLSASGCGKHQQDITIYENGNIYTCDDSLPHASAMVVSKGKILFIGEADDLQEYKDKTCKHIDLHGKTVLPGFIESHAHPACYGFMDAGDMLVIDGGATKEEILEQLEEYLNKHPDAPHISSDKDTDWLTSDCPKEKHPRQRISTGYLTVFLSCCMTKDVIRDGPTR